MSDNLDLSDIIRPKIAKSNLTYYFNLCLYLLFLAGGILLLLLNIPGYSLNSKMSSLIYCLLMANVVFLVYGIFLLNRWYTINKGRQIILTQLNNQIRFISTIYEAWLLIIPFSILNLSFSFTILMENDHGNYPVIDKWKILGMYLLMYIGLYALNKLANYFQKRPLKEFRDNLEI